MERIPTALHGLALILTFTPPSPALAKPATVAQQSLQQRVEAKLSEAGAGTRFGLVVAGEDGQELIAIAPDARFIPASNTKMFTTAAAFATIGTADRLRQPDSAGGTSVHLQQQGRQPPKVVLKGNGDARLSSAPDCVTNCLAVLADAVAAKARAVGDIVGDDTLFPDQRWSPGMSWNNLHTRYGTAASALTLDDNELPMRVLPTVAGQPPRLELLPYYTVENHVLTIAAGATKLEFTRQPGSRVVRLTGTIVAGAEPERLALAIDNPAHYAAWRFKSLLEARGVRVTGRPVARHRPFERADDPAERKGAAPIRAAEGEPLARVVPNPLIEDLTVINKVSQNLHAELMLRRVGLEKGTGSIEDGVAAIGAMLGEAGVPRAAYDFSDGSGMSTYNRAGPRGTVIFLRWVWRQPWGAAWRATLPIGGVDGTLAKRFSGSALRGRLFAKTGTLNATNALSGFMIARSGRTLLFSAFANDVPESVSATKVMDAALELIASEN
jgi:D-alanyl-D-alanine carboxypeptidase/D-alanyl-D-alanine-endopeptidase (penicillin-binding protein 4)